LEHSWLYLSLVFAVGLIAGGINILSAGGSFITLPVLIFMGLSPAAANGTNRIAILAQGVTAGIGYKKERLTDLKTSLKLSLFTLPGAVLGALLAIDVSEIMFKRILAIVLVLGVAGMAFHPSRKTERGLPDSPWLRGALYLAMFGIGLYGGFIQAGTGLLLMIVVYPLLGIDLVRVNVHKILIITLFNLPVLAVFLWSGNVHWKIGAVLALGTTLGAYLATRLTLLKSGEKIIRIMVGVALILMAVRLFWS
jgi:uncharacterized membrane protein YfcA